ncbi:MAG TPA: hypothetical protein VHN17_08220 [Steroidobacteraceae bacterium]|nr:hypothetical protein [Steroidobacteraceae bacterium]
MPARAAFTIGAVWLSVVDPEQQRELRLTAGRLSYRCRALKHEAVARWGVRPEAARHMNVDPSLIRHYFRDRSTLLLAAVARLSAELSRLVIGSDFDEQIMLESGPKFASLTATRERRAARQPGHEPLPLRPASARTRTRVGTVLQIATTD